MASTPRAYHAHDPQPAAKRMRIEVQLASKPRDYVPGSGPPLQRISLLPPRDSTAYILERILLPSSGAARDGKPLPRRMTYVVGWRDLPAARLLVPAMEILQYVSPRDLETWEWEKELEMEAERAKLEVEKAMDVKGQPKKKKKGRPPTHTDIQAAIVAEPEPDATPKRLKKGAMSLSTPHKVALGRFEGLSEDDESPSRQLDRELYGQQPFSDSGDLMDMEVDTTDMEVDAPISVPEKERSKSEICPEPGRPPVLQRASTSSRIAEFAAALRPPFHRQTPQPFATPGISKEISPFPFPNERPAPANGEIPTSTNSFRPAARSTSAFSSGNSNKSGLDDIPARPTSKKLTSNSKPKPSKKPPPKQPLTKSAPESKSGPVQVAEEGGWEVQRLEGMELYEVEGRGLVRYFKVRWEGNWPPEQNPSWEPEENIPPKLVQSYMRNGKRLGKERGPSRPTSSHRPAAKKTKLKQTILPWATANYSSVSEAFSGGNEWMDSNAAGQGVDDDIFGTEGELFVVQ